MVSFIWMLIWDSYVFSCLSHILVDKWFRFNMVWMTPMMMNGRWYRSTLSFLMNWECSCETRQIAFEGFLWFLSNHAIPFPEGVHFLQFAVSHLVFLHPQFFADQLRFECVPKLILLKNFLTNWIYVQIMPDWLKLLTTTSHAFKRVLSYFSISSLL